MEAHSGRQWTRLHDVRVLEYVGRGESVRDNGLAVGGTALSPLHHFFEVKILDPGESCYVAIGLARKDYPVGKHPGWNRGSIAYHADDGKIFIGSGVGTPFGPRCGRDDVLGCGLVFPVKYVDPGPDTWQRWPWEIGSDVIPPKVRCRRSAPPGPPTNEHSSESEDDLWWNNRNQVYEDVVQVFFLRNQKLLGTKEVRIPKGGFYPVIGMMSPREKVRVNLNPLSG